MTQQTITTSGEIPEALESFYIDQEGGLIPRGIREIFRPYSEVYQPLIEQGLVGAGTIAPMSQFQQALGTQLAGMTTPDQFSLATQAGQVGASGLQALMGVQAPTVGTPQTFGYEQAQQYMSPYMQGVVDVQQRRAIDAARAAQLGGCLLYTSDAADE